MGVMELMAGTGILKSGDLLGKYRILRLLGSWGIADIYEAEKIISGHHAVLKVLSPEFTENKNNTLHPQKKIIPLPEYHGMMLKLLPYGFRRRQDLNIVFLLRLSGNMQHETGAGISNFAGETKNHILMGRKAANIADESAGAHYSTWTIWKGYNDGYIYTSPVGNFASNALGLYDMGGNVWKWCGDVYNKNAYKHHSMKNPLYISKDRYRVIRGGSWYNDPKNVRCTNRYFLPPDKRNLDVGFRLVTGDIKLP